MCLIFKNWILLLWQKLKINFFCQSSSIQFSKIKKNISKTERVKNVWFSPCITAILTLPVFNKIVHNGKNSHFFKKYFTLTSHSLINIFRASSTTHSPHPSLDRRSYRRWADVAKLLDEFFFEIFFSARCYDGTQTQAIKGGVRGVRRHKKWNRFSESFLFFIATELLCVRKCGLFSKIVDYLVGHR